MDNETTITVHNTVYVIQPNDDEVSFVKRRLWEWQQRLKTAKTDEQRQKALLGIQAHEQWLQQRKVEK